MATLGEILRACSDKALMQLLPECVLGARAVKARKGAPAFTRIEFATTNMTPNDLLYWSGELGHPRSRRPQYVGIVVWVPYDDYEASVDSERNGTLESAMSDRAVRRSSDGP